MNETQLKVYQERAKRFHAALLNRLFSDTRTLDAQISPSVQPIAFKDRKKGKFQTITEGGRWGKPWESAWIRITGKVPAEWAGQPVFAKLELGGEILIFSDKGLPLYSLTNTSAFVSQYRKNLYPLIETAKGGETIDLWAELCAAGIMGDEESTDYFSGNFEAGLIRHLTFGVFNRDAWHLHNDFTVLQSLLATQPEKSYRRVQLTMALNRAIDLFADDPANAVPAREALAPELAKPALRSALSTTAVGHAHIDTGWLWPVRETIRKCARTFASQLDNLDRYPGYVFGASAPQHYAWMKEHYPELFEKIKARVAEGRWEPQGGMWVEADCNIISGESMVRQFLHGKNFYMDEFGFDVKNLWLPDVFGYSAAMPQIIRKAGCDWFVTQKISWSQFNKFPYHTFLWRGIDNTEVMTHFPPEDTYNSFLIPEGLCHAQNNFNENYFLPEFLTLFGVGDGGGGPRPEHIENGLRTANLEGAPQVKFGRADQMLKRLAKYAEEFPGWVGELYLELHRGTLTTQARTKRGNRRSEQLLTAAEFLLSALPAGEYPRRELEALWKKVLINQFHDIIPGSSIGGVYSVTEAEHAEVLAACERLIGDAAAKLLTADDEALTVINTLSCDYVSPVRLPDDWAGRQVLDAAGREVILQSEADGGVWALGNFPPQSLTTLRRGKARKAAKAKLANSLLLENELVRYEFDRQGRLVSAFDKTTENEVISGAAGNLLALYVDRPNNWDAWDVDFTYMDTPPEYAKAVRVERTADGPVRQALAFELTVGQSKIRQQAVLAANSKRLDFVTEVDWHESFRMLRVSFPTTVTTAEASCDIQYGFARRPTHRNTSWDIARFEVAAHRYVDLSDANGGAALLNDCKYGYKLQDGVLDLNLLRSPKYPDPDADQGKHLFTYSFLPHAGGLVGSEVMQEAACLNRAPFLFAGSAGTAALPCRLVEGQGVSLEVLKRGEKSDRRVIRLVETDGTNSAAVLAVPEGSTLVETNLVEWQEGAKKKSKEGRVEVALRPFEIKTYFIQ